MIPDSWAAPTSELSQKLEKDTCDHIRMLGMDMTPQLPQTLDINPTQHWNAKNLIECRKPIGYPNSFAYPGWLGHPSMGQLHEDRDAAKFSRPGIVEKGPQMISETDGKLPPKSLHRHFVPLEY